MNKQDLIAAVAKACGVTNSVATTAVNTVFSSIIKSLASGQRVSVAGFGRWDVTKRPARMGVNPRNPNQKIQIPPTTVCRFRSGVGLKEAIK